MFVVIVCKFISGGKSGRRRVPGNIISFDEDDVSGRSEDGNGSIGRSSPLAHNTPPIEVGCILVLGCTVLFETFFPFRYASAKASRRKLKLF